MISLKKPEIIVFAGPNGSGKSTVKNLIQVKCLYINADDIKKSNNCDDLEAAKVATKLREDTVNKENDFAFETVLSTNRNIDLLKRAKDKGYFIRSYFILTKDVTININRVAMRVNKGGHDVPIDKIISRYKKSLDNLKELIKLSDVCNVYDNSNSVIKRIFKKRKTEFFYDECKRWNEKEISILTGVSNAVYKDLN